MHKTGTEPNELSYQESFVRGPGLSRVPKVCALVPIAGDSPGDQEEGVIQGKKPASGSPGPKTERAGGVAVKRTPGGTSGKGARAQRGADLQDQRGKCGLRSAAETRVRGARREQGAREGARAPLHGLEGGVRAGARGRQGEAEASAEPGWPAPSGSKSLPNLRGRSARPSGFREVTARVSTPTRPTHLGSPLAAARQAGLALHHPVRPPAAALLRRLLLFVPHCTTLPPPPRK